MNRSLPDDGLMDPRGEVSRAALPGGAVTVLRRGSGPPLLLLHGIPLSMLTWRHNVGPLSRDAEVIAVDMRGFGGSDKPRDADYSVPGQARTLLSLLDHLGLGSAAVVGSSYAGAVAVTLAHTAPERIRKVVLINPVCYPLGSHSAARLARIGVVSALAGPLLRRPPIGRRVIAGPLRRSYTDRSLATPQLIAEYHRLLVRGSGERAFLSALRSLDEDEVVRRIPEVRQETLVLWGRGDRVLPPTHARRLASELPSAHLEILDGVGHLPHEEAPARVNSLISAFLTEGAATSWS